MKQYVLLIGGIPCICSEMIQGYKILGAGTDWECQAIVDEYILQHEDEYDTIHNKLKQIENAVGQELNVTTAHGVVVIEKLISEVGKDVFEKVIVATLLDKSERGTDGRLVPSTCEFVKELAKTVPNAHGYRVYEHPYLWNEAVQAYMRILWYKGGIKQ